MSDPSANSSERGFVPFSAAGALAGNRGEAGDPAARVPPPLPPAPPGAEIREMLRQAPPGTSTSARPAPPPVPDASGSRSEAWSRLVDWCVEAGVADGGLLADDAGAVLESRGDAPVADVGLAASGLCAAVASARAAASAAPGPAPGAAPVAAAMDVGGRWITGFAVRGAGGEPLVAALWGKAPLRAPVRAALAAWIGRAGDGPAPGSAPP